MISDRDLAYTIRDKELRAQTLEEHAQQQAILRAQEEREKRLEDAAHQLSLLRAKSRDGSAAASARKRRQTIDESPLKDSSRPTSSRRRRQTLDENSFNDVKKDGSRPSSSHVSMSRKSRMSITVLPGISDTIQNQSPSQNGTKTPRSLSKSASSRPISSQNTPRNSITPRKSIKLDPLPFTDKHRASFDSKKVLFSSNSQTSSTGEFSPPQTPQTSKKASISITDAPSSPPPTAIPLERVYSASKIVQGGVDVEDAIAGMGLQQKEMKQLKMAFDAIDETGHGEIEYDQFLRALGETVKPGRPNNPFIVKLFQIIDMDRDGGMGFDEFLVLSGTFMMFTHIDMVRYVFECHNKMVPGCFGPEDFIELTRQINAVVADGGPKDWETTCDIYDKIGKGYLNEAEFTQMSKDFPQLICFASRIQLKLQNLSLGQRFFDKLLQRQQRARIMNAYKNTHGGIPPPENILFVGLRKMTMCFAGDTYDVRTHDNTQLLNLGRILFDRMVAMQKPMMTKMKSFKSQSPSPSNRPKSARKSFS